MYLQDLTFDRSDGDMRCKLLVSLNCIYTDSLRPLDMHVLYHVYGVNFIERMKVHGLSRRLFLCLSPVNKLICP